MRAGSSRPATARRWAGEVRRGRAERGIAGSTASRSSSLRSAAHGPAAAVDLAPGRIPRSPPCPQRRAAPGVGPSRLMAADGRGAGAPDRWTSSHDMVGVASMVLPWHTPGDAGQTAGTGQTLARTVGPAGHTCEKQWRCRRLTQRRPNCTAVTRRPPACARARTGTGDLSRRPASRPTVGRNPRQTTPAGRRSHCPYRELERLRKVDDRDSLQTCSGRAEPGERTIVEVAGRRIGGDRFATIAGPCAVESREVMLETRPSRPRRRRAAPARRRLQAPHLAVLVPGPGRGGAAPPGRGQGADRACRWSPS